MLHYLAIVDCETMSDHGNRQVCVIVRLCHCAFCNCYLKMMHNFEIVALLSIGVMFEWCFLLKLLNTSLDVEFIDVC